MDDKGAYRGGVIYAGVGISLEALVEGTSLLPNISIDPPKKTVATNTIEAMKSGAFYSTIGGLDGILDRFEAEIGPAKSIIATGGLASHVAPYTRHKLILDDYLMLEGLKIIYDKNKKQARRKGPAVKTINSESVWEQEETLKHLSVAQSFFIICSLY